AAWAATAGYWYARNTVATGNPVYPAAFLGRPGTTFPETTLREYAAHYGLRRTVDDALVVYVDWPRAYAALAVLALVGLAGWHGPKTAATAASIYTEPLFGAAAAVLYRQPLGMRVAVFGDQWVYPAFGARDHLVPLRLDRDGRVAARPIGDAMEPGDLTVDA